MRPAALAIIGTALGAAAGHAFRAPFPGMGGNPVLDLIAYHDPGLHTVIRVWYYAAPAVVVVLAGSVCLSVWRVWLQPRARGGGRGRLPAWPTSPEDDAPSLVVGELHHPVVPRESERPSWLVIPETGLYTGVLIVGAVGSGKTTACMYPFAQQLLSWQADRAGRRASALVLEVKGDFCYSVRRILDDAGRGGDYLEIGLDGSLQWNPLDDPLLDSYSLAYGVASLINQLFGKSREPFWQQAYTNLVRWIIELYRLLPKSWVTLQDIYRCTVDAELFGRKIGEARELADRLCPVRAVIATKDLAAHKEPLGEWGWEPVPGSDKAACHLDPALRDRLKELKVAYETEESGGGAGSEFREQVEAIERWYLHDWTALDAKLRTSIVEGISVFLSLFDQPQVAGVFCPPPPDPDAEAGRSVPGLRRRLPPLSELIEGGKVLALNMPAGANPALARAIGVLLKNAWMQALLRRPAELARRPGRYLRPAVFICDEYQAFATVGQDDPSGDEKAFALTRQCRCVPIVATQSISSLRSVLPGGEAWRTLLQTLRTRIFLSLVRRVVGPDRVRDVRERHEDAALLHVHRDHGQARVLALVRASRRGPRHDRREQVVPAGRGSRSSRPGTSALLANYQAICLPYDGVEVAPCPARLPETPLPAEGRGLLAAPRGGTDMKRASGIGHLQPFLPGLETLLEDPEVSEIMINGPGNVWIERGGRLEPHEAPGLTAAWLHRAAIHIARPLGLDPAARPILDARLEDGSRVAICTPPASPEVAITIRRFGGRAFSAQDLVRMGSLPETVLGAARSALLARRNILVSGGTGSGKTTLLNALIELLPEDERIVAIEDTLELRIERANCLRFEAGAVGTETPVSIRDLVRHALRHRPDHIVVGEVRGGEAADLLQALNTGHGGSLTTIHANNARSALSRLASCAMQAEGALPWEVTCRGVVDGIALVLHTTRQRGRRFVEEALEVRGYDAAKGRWIAEPIWSGVDEAPQEQHPHTKEVNP